MNYSLSNMLGRSNGGGPVISGTAFPGETLTSTRTGQWYADSNAISGQTGSTYVVLLSDIGKVITQTGSNALTIWHPDDIAGVVRFWSSLSNVLTSITPDVPAANGDSVRRWSGIISGTQTDQSDGTKQPIYRSTGQSGNPSLEFDGSNDNIGAGSSDLLKNAELGYLFVGCRDITPTAGLTNHVAVTIENGTTSARINIATRNSSNQFIVASQRIDGGATTSVVGGANNSNYNVHTAECFWASNIFNYRINGSQVGTTNFGGGGNTSNSNSNGVNIGSSRGLFNFFPGHITVVCVANASLTATERSQLERYIGLFGNLNIPLV
jgi:hypothetical protein